MTAIFCIFLFARRQPIVDANANGRAVDRLRFRSSEERRREGNDQRGNLVRHKEGKEEGREQKADMLLERTREK